MKGQSLRRLYGRLSRNEVKKLLLFTLSPYFTVREDVKSLLGFMNLKGANFQEKAAYTKVYPGKKFDATKFRLLCSYTYKTLKRFLLIEKFESSKQTTELLLADVFEEHQLQKDYLAALQSYRKKLDEQPIRDQEYWRKSFEWNQEYLDKTSQNRLAVESLETITHDFKLYFLSAITKQLAHIITQEKVASVEFDKELHEGVLSFLSEPENQYLKIPSISIYYFFYRALAGPSDEYFDKMMLVLNAKAESFSKKELHEIYLLAGNYCIRMANREEGNYRDYYRYYFDLYSQGLQDGILLENGKVSRFNLKNLVTVALRLEEPEKAAAFLEENEEKLHRDEFREAIINFCRAKIALAKTNYEEAHSLVLNFHSKDDMYNLESKYMLFQIYFSWREFDLLEAHIKSWEVYLQRKTDKIPNWHFQYYKKLIQSGSALYRYGLSKSEENSEKLQDKIDQLDKEAERIWFRKSRDSC